MNLLVNLIMEELLKGIKDFLEKLLIKKEPYWIAKKGWKR